MARTVMSYPPGNENEPGLIHVYGSFTPDDGSTAVSTATACGKGVTYTSDAAGTYTLAFADKFKTCVYASAHLVGTNSTDQVWVKSVSPTTSEAIIESGTTKGTPADVSSTDQTVYFHFVFKKTTA
jgi:hypothetical protein